MSYVAHLASVGSRRKVQRQVIGSRNLHYQRIILSANAKQSRAAVEQRNLIVPQMRDYDELGMNQEWVPHLMYFHPRNVALKSVSTDEYGIRKTSGARTDSRTALLIGGSSVFGIGATSDSKTIPSLLNTLTKFNWHNLGGRSFTSTQEAILLHLTNFKRIDGPIIVMSGINNLILSLMAGSFSPMYGAIFYQRLFEQQMKSAAVGNRALARQLIAGLCEKFGLSKKSNTQSASHTPSTKAESYEAMLTVFERDCEYLQMLAKRNNTTATFVMQPFIPWLNKSLSPEEINLFALLDQEVESFLRILIALAEHKAQYARDVEAICANVGLKFLDLNIASEFQQPEWLFVDRAHLTDAGYATIAKLLVRDLSL